MDIFNRPAGIAEDTLQYTLYPSPASADKSSVTSLATLIEAYVKELLPPDFIWHRDVFELKVVLDSQLSAKGKNDIWKLEGRMRVGDSVDDEWCVVWLLREISKTWDIAVTVYDSDGEFLLIEAADYLPSWVKPSNSENRVWIYHGNLHLIPLSHHSSPSSKSKQRRKLDGQDSDEEENFADDDEEGCLNVQDALRALTSDDATEASKEVQEAAWKRIAGYPGAARQHIHVAKAHIPVDIVKALLKEPSLVQRAAETFYTRDALQLRAAHRMSRFPPQMSVLSPVRMTRTAYAQLVGQKFHPPKIFGQFKEREGTREWKWRDLGMKIACGFEMLYQESKSKSEGMSSETLKGFAAARKDALRRNAEYIEYIQKLQSTGYFKNELEGSQLWNELEDRAAEVFVNSRRDEDSTRPSFATLVNNAISQSGENPTLPDLEEESDDWLNIDAEGFDEKLTETMRPREKISTNKQDAMDVDQPAAEDQESRVAQAQADKLKGLAKKIEKFVEGEGSLEGAVFDDEQISEDEQQSEFSDEEFSSDSEDDMQQAEDEVDAAKKVARQEAMDKLVPPLNPSEYGKMPPEFYTNSQKVAPATLETEQREESGDQQPSSQANTMKASAAAILEQGKPNETSLSKPIRRPILPRDDFDGVDSDDETDEDEGGEDEEEEEDRPQVVGDLEIDMGQEEEEFLEFSRRELGISDDMWNDILRDRKGRGAYVPKGIEVKQNRLQEQKDTSRQAKAKPGEGPGQQLQPPQSGPRPNQNPNLDSFEAVMEAMEAELTKAKLAKKPSASSQKTASTRSKLKTSGDTAPLPTTKGKEKAKQGDVKMDEEDEDLEAAMDAELRAALEREEGDSGDEEPMDYGMIKNLLESFKSQAGVAGPFSTLAGRLEPGWLPRDDS